MRQFIALFILLAGCVSTSQAVTNELFNTGPSSLSANINTNIATITNGDLAGDRVITIDAVMTRQESSGGDTWFGLGLNTPTPGGGTAIVTANDVGYLTRMRTDSGTNHQVFNIPGSEASAGSSTNTTKHTTATITLSSGSITSGQLADIVVRYDENNDGTAEHIVGGTFDWNANQAAVNIRGHNKSYDYELAAIASSTNFDLFDTGVDAANAVIAAGGVDTHWEIVSSPAGPFGDATVQQNHPAWLANDAAGTVGGSSWISIVPQGTTNIAPGDYTFEQVFSLDGFDASTAVVVLDIAVDNGAEVFLNGSSLFSTGGFASFNGPFEITSGFLQGQNTLSILVNNAGAGNNPGGLRVNVLQATADLAVPEPTTATLGLIGLAGLLARRRRAA